MFRRVVELTPDNARGYSNLGVMYQMLGRWEIAIATYETALRLDPDNYRAHSNLGTAYFFQGEYAKAAAAFERVLVLNDTDYRVWGNLADAYRWTPSLGGKAKPTYEHAVELVQNELSVNARRVGARAFLAEFLVKLGRREEALAALARAQSLARDDIDVLHAAAVVHRLTGDSQRARVALRKMIEQGYSEAEVRNDPEFKDMYEELFMRE